MMMFRWINKQLGIYKSIEIDPVTIKISMTEYITHLLNRQAHGLF